MKKSIEMFLFINDAYGTTINNKYRTFLCVHAVTTIWKYNIVIISIDGHWPVKYL